MSSSMFRNVETVQNFLSPVVQPLTVELRDIQVGYSLQLLASKLRIKVNLKIEVEKESVERKSEAEKKEFSFSFPDLDLIEETRF